MPNCSPPKNSIRLQPELKKATMRGKHAVCGKNSLVLKTSFQNFQFFFFENMFLPQLAQNFFLVANKE